MSDLEKTLKSMMGEKGFETLKKTIYRRDSDSALGPLDMYLPMLVLPRTILSWLVQNIKPMQANEIKQIKFPGNDKIVMHIQKHGRDAYRAEFVEGGRIIHSFEKQTLPGIGGHLMTVGEMYESLIDDEPKAKAVDLEESAVPTTMMGMVTPPPSAEDSEKFKWLCAQENVKDLTGVIGKLVDAFVANQLFKDNIAQAVDKVKDSEKPETIVEYKEDLGKEAKDPTGKVKDVELDPGKAPKKEILQKPYVSDAQRRFFHSSGAKKAGLTAKDVKHWDEASKGKKLPEKVAKLEPPSGAASPHMPKQPQGAAPMVKPSHNPQAAQNKQGQVTFKQKFGKLAKPKAPANYFQNKLANVAKSEFHVTTEQLYQPCVQCGTAEFVKNEDGMPHYSPCACFGVTLQSSSGKKTTFVELKKSGAGYSLKFSNKADQDTIKAFLLTLRTRLKK